MISKASSFFQDSNRSTVQNLFQINLNFITKSHFITQFTNVACQCRFVELSLQFSPSASVLFLAIRVSHTEHKFSNRKEHKNHSQSNFEFLIRCISGFFYVPHRALFVCSSFSTIVSISISFVSNLCSEKRIFVRLLLLYWCT